VDPLASQDHQLDSLFHGLRYLTAWALLARPGWPLGQDLSGFQHSDLDRCEYLLDYLLAGLVTQWALRDRQQNVCGLAPGARMDYLSLLVTSP